MYSNAVLRQAIKHFGHTNQIFKALEEMGELNIELFKHIKSKGNLDDVHEEIIDVYIMMEQLMIMFDLDDDAFNKIYVQKIERLKERLEGSYYEKEKIQI